MDKGIYAYQCTRQPDQTDLIVLGKTLSKPQQTRQIDQADMLELGQTYVVTMRIQSWRLAEEQASPRRDSIEEVETYGEGKRFDAPTLEMEWEAHDKDQETEREANCLSEEEEEQLGDLAQLSHLPEM